VEAIAAAYGLTAEVTDTGRTVESEPQGGLSDFLFVEKLAKENEFVFFVEEDRLYFGPRRLEESPVLDVEYFTAKAEGIVKGFRPRSNRSSTKGPATTVKGIGFDPFEREPKVHEAAENTTEEPRLSGRYFDAETGEFRLMETEPTPHQTEEEVRKSAETTRREAELGQFEAQLSLIGSPMVRANRQIRIRGVGRRYSGNWRITRAKHTIGEGGYTTDLTLSRDGIGDQQPGTAESARPVNDSEAVPQGGERMLIFDAETGETVGASD
jgi:phage protein D